MGSLENQVGRCARLQWALSGLLAAGFCVFYLAAYRPANQRLERLQGRIAGQHDELDANRAQLKSLPGLRNDVTRLRAQLDGLNRRLAIQKSSMRHLELFGEQPIGISFEGDFLSVFNFLRQVEDLQRLIRIKSLTMSTRDPQQGHVDVHVAMNVYFAE